jgi:Leucine-rich repeat (LRR) protein
MVLFPASISLPNLQSLNVNTCGLTSLEGLLSNLSAPSLTFLDTSNNRLTGSLPSARSTYPKLVTFLVADNKISSLDFDSVKGLQVLDVSNNNINFLPPKIGLLATETSGPKWTGGPGLRRFDVTGNTFKVPRWQTVSKGTEAILEWLKAQISTEEVEEWVNAGEEINPDDED